MAVVHISSANSRCARADLNYLLGVFSLGCKVVNPPRHNANHPSHSLIDASLPSSTKAHWLSTPVWCHGLPNGGYASVQKAIRQGSTAAEVTFSRYAAIFCNMPKQELAEGTAPTASYEFLLGYRSVPPKSLTKWMFGPLQNDDFTISIPSPSHGGEASCFWREAWSVEDSPAYNRS